MEKNCKIIISEQTDIHAVFITKLIHYCLVIIFILPFIQL